MNTTKQKNQNKPDTENLNIDPELVETKRTNQTDLNPPIVKLPVEEPLDAPPTQGPGDVPPSTEENRAGEDVERPFSEQPNQGVKADPVTGNQTRPNDENERNDEVNQPVDDRKKKLQEAGRR